MSLNFVWNMTEENWRNLVSDHKLAKTENPSGNFSADADVYGNCSVGALKVDIQHTLDPDNCYAYANVYALGVDNGYGETESGVPYELLDGGPHVPIRCKSFETFRKNFERGFAEYIASNERKMQFAEMPLAVQNDSAVAT